MKNTLLCLLINLVFINFAQAEENLGFMQNQRYVCIGTHAIAGDKVIQVQSLEDAKKYPTRFYIDDDMILHTDGKTDNKLTYVGEEAFKSNDSIILLKIEDNKRMMFRILINGPLKGLSLIFDCIETENWTLFR